MTEYSELDFRHHDFRAKWQSLTAALQTDLGADATRAAIDGVWLLRTAMWRQGFWRAFERDVDLALAAAAAAGLERERDELLAYKIGLNEALGRWPQVAAMARTAMASARSPETISAAAFRLGVALHYLGRPCEGARLLVRASAELQSSVESIEIRHKYHRLLRALGRPRAARRLLEGLIGHADEWLSAEMFLDMASLEGRARPERALAWIAKARRIYSAREFARGLAYTDLEEGLVRLRLEGPAVASAFILRAEQAFVAEHYRPGQVHAAFARALLAAREGRPAEASACFDHSMTAARQLSYVNAAARAALAGLPSHLRAGRAARAWSAVRILAESSVIRGVDLLANGVPPADPAKSCRPGAGPRQAGEID
jgi:hypothetical protein